MFNGTVILFVRFWFKVFHGIYLKGLDLKNFIVSEVCMIKVFFYFSDNEDNVGVMSIKGYFQNLRDD